MISGGFSHEFNVCRMRFQSACPRQCGERLLLRLVREVKVFETLDRLGGFDRGGQFGRQLSLRLDRAENRLLALGVQTLAHDALLDLTNLLFVETACLVLAIARDERHGVAGVEQADDRCHARLLQTEPMRYLLEIDCRRSWHRVTNPEPLARRRNR